MASLKNRVDYSKMEEDFTRERNKERDVNEMQNVSKNWRQQKKKAK